MNKHRLKVWLLLFLYIFFGCGVIHKTEMNKIMDIYDVKEITYRFIDASVPPAYHRSYTITVMPSRAHIVVDSYGKVLAEKNYTFLSGQFNGLLASFQKNDIRNCQLDEGDGCTGGTSEKISLSNGKENVFNGMAYHCGGEDYGDMCGNISAFAKDIKKAVPDLRLLIK